MKEASNATKGGQTEKNDAPEAMVMALKEKNEAIMEKIKDLEGELAMCKVTAGKKMLASVSKQLIIDVPKPKEFKEMSSTRDVDKKDMFESSNPKGNGNGREDEERQVENGNNNSNNEKPQKWEEEARH
ncbi:hypothetical protein Gorai_016755 [Gossypium raimondii]|uniref:Uncharacterized protein n=1 Tax=Gossypium raimondii TaxID=29730 RepID=A0A7J8PAE9_GOSRA|nr:hypothetical protein [Gossypium raimondii]